MAKAGPGAPGKRGTLIELFEIMLQGVDRSACMVMYSNLTRDVFTGDKFQAAHRHFKVADIDLLFKIYGLVRKSLEYEEESDSLQGAEVGPEVESLPSRSELVEGSGQSQRIQL